MKRVVIFLVLAVVALSAFVSNGAATSPSRATRAAVIRVSRTFERAFLAGNGRAACRAMSSAGRRRIVALHPHRGTCQDAIAALSRGGILAAQAWGKAASHVAEVDVEGSRARVFFGTPRTRIFEFDLARSAAAAWGVSLEIERSAHFKL